MRIPILPGFLLFVVLSAAHSSAQPYYDPDILALLNKYGCTECHGGSGGLLVTPYASILTTGNHGPVVVPGDTNSVIILKLKGTAGFGDRMPRGGAPVDPEDLRTFVNWISTGAPETAPTSIETETGLPAGFSLSQNYPNPFNPTTRIRFQVPQAGDVRLTVHDHLGRDVGTLVDAWLDAGSYEVAFDALRSSGGGGRSAAGPLASGVYLYRLRVGPYDATRKMVIVK
jgi:hypothetical protein